MQIILNGSPIAAVRLSLATSEGPVEAKICAWSRRPAFLRACREGNRRFRLLYHERDPRKVLPMWITDAPLARAAPPAGE